MKKNSTNTFDGGLNYDLTPLGTPNNVLTDCVNGTFVTFNADELALQNDAGNTKINLYTDKSAFVLGTFYTLGIIVFDPLNIDNYYECIQNTTGTQILTNNFYWKSILGCVKLSEGFYPLGIKEYGGVLYIVSAKLKDLPKTDEEWEEMRWKENGSYSQNQDVWYFGGTEKVYYRSIVNNNREPLPIESNKDWEYIGNVKDYNNRYAKVEFGSYPSPEGSGNKPFDGIDLVYCNEQESSDCGNIILFDKLYKKIQINTQDFKSTRYVTFNYNLENKNHISNYLPVDGSTKEYNPIFYKIKLYHQLNNGYLDLTEDIWEKYFQNKGQNLTNNYYFQDENEVFKYYCPSRYKGKLTVSLEIEELKKFRLYNVATLNFDPVNEKYTFVLEIEAEGVGIISVPEAKVQLWIDGIEVVGIPNIVISNINNIGKLTHANIDGELKDKLIQYKITPVLLVQGNTYTAYDLPLKIPQEYWDKFIIEGSRLINTSYDDVIFTRVEGNTTCLSDLPIVSTYVGYKVYNEMILQNGVGININSKLEPVLDESTYVFLYKDTIPTSPNSVILGYYNITTEFISNPMSIQLKYTPTLIQPLEDLNPDPQLNTIIETLFEKNAIIIEQAVGECGSPLPIIPKFVGVNNLGIPSLLNDMGEYIKANYSWNISGVVNAQYTCIDYYVDKSDSNPINHKRQLFVGGKSINNNSVLNIYDLSDPDNITRKQICPFNGGMNVSFVKVITDITPHILIGRAYGGGESNTVQVYMIPYHDDIDDYMNFYDSGSDIVGTGVVNKGNKLTEDLIRSVLYYGGKYYGVSTAGELFSRQGPLSTPYNWIQVFDKKDSNYIQIRKGASKMWITDTRDRMQYFNLSNINNLTQWGLDGQTRQNSVNMCMLKNDASLITTIDADRSIFKVEDNATSSNITPSEVDYVLGVCFDGTKYAYASTRLATVGNSSKLATYNAYPETGDSLNLWTYIDTPEPYYALYLY